MTFTTEELQEFKQQAALLQPILRLGKSGLTPGVVQELERQLKHRGLIKVKLLKALTETRDRHQLAAELATKTNATLVHAVGSIVILAKKPGRERPVLAKHRGSRFPAGFP